MTLRLSPITAINYQILKSDYELLDPENPTTAPDDFSLQFDASEPTRQDNGTDIIEALLRVHLSAGNDPAGFKLDVSVRGMFAAMFAEECGTFEEYKMFMRINAYSLLYAFIRSHVQMLTSMTPSEQVCLPCLDVASIAESVSEQFSTKEDVAE